MSNKESWYFAYGSNLSKQQMNRRIGSIPTSILASLPNYRLAFRQVLRGCETYATIVPEQGAMVFGVAYLCNQEAFDLLDGFEGVAQNCYRRESVVISSFDGKPLTGYVYIGDQFLNAESKPASNYLDLILTGAREHQLPSDYIQFIENIAK